MRILLLIDVASSRCAERVPASVRRLAEQAGRGDRAPRKGPPGFPSPVRRDLRGRRARRRPRLVRWLSWRPAGPAAAITAAASSCLGSDPLPASCCCWPAEAWPARGGLSGELSAAKPPQRPGAVVCGGSSPQSGPHWFRRGGSHWLRLAGAGPHGCRPIGVAWRGGFEPALDPARARFPPGRVVCAVGTIIPSKRLSTAEWAPLRGSRRHPLALGDSWGSTPAAYPGSDQGGRPARTACGGASCSQRLVFPAKPSTWRLDARSHLFVLSSRYRGFPTCCSNDGLGCPCCARCPTVPAEILPRRAHACSALTPGDPLALPLSADGIPCPWRLGKSEVRGPLRRADPGQIPGVLQAV